MAPNNNNPGIRPSLTVGGRVMTDMSNLIVLHARFASGANRYFGACKSNGTAAYQVTAGKTLRIIAARVAVGTAASGGPIALGYSDAAITLAGTAGAPTNPIYNGGSNGVYTATTGVLGVTEFALNFTIPATKYVHHDQGTATADGAVTYYGYEE